MKENEKSEETKPEGTAEEEPSPAKLSVNIEYQNHLRKFHGTYLPHYVCKPWGWETIWAHTDKYVGKILHIEAGKRLSLQYHVKKDETIRVLSGRLELETRDQGKRVFRSLAEGEVFHITPGMHHRMSAITTCEVLEVSTPELDDVIRVEDDYDRLTSKDV